MPTQPPATHPEHPNLLTETNTLIDSYTQLPHNWDSYGAPPIPHHVTEQAKKLLQKTVNFGLPIPVVAPGSDGSVGFEWETDGAELYLSADNDTNPTYYLLTKNGEETEGELLTEKQLTEILHKYTNAPTSTPTQKAAVHRPANKN